MKAFYAFFLLSCTSIFCVAQNLVLNPSLENYITCPGFGQFSNTYINDWGKPSFGSTDYYRVGCPGIIPTQQVPHTGIAYAGIIGYNFGAEYREYMTGTLSAPLIPGATYYCEFYVSLNDGYIQAIKEIGAYFSVTPPGPYGNSLHIPVQPQVVNTTILLDDTSMWMRVSGYFLASGGEEYITIGNFFNDSNTTIMQVGNVGSYGSYYFVDDVWVSLSEGTGINEYKSDEIFMYPNPASGHLEITIPAEVRKSITNYSIEIFNSTGELVFIDDRELSNNTKLQIHDLPCGVYFIILRSGEKLFGKKFIKD